jgi:hypothetical protein
MEKSVLSVHHPFLLPSFLFIILTSFLMFHRKMINLFKIKGQKREEAANSNGGPPVKKQSPGELRLHKGLFYQK